MEAKYFYWIKNKVDKNHIWLNPILIAITTITAGFFTYQLPEEFKKSHPIRSEFVMLFLDWSLVIFIISTLLLIVLTIINSINQKTIQRVEHKLLKIEEKVSFINDNIRNLFDGYLLNLANNKLLFNSNNDGSDRITLYIHDKNSNFIPFSRFSSNPKFSRFGRTSYPDDKGCISEGWTKGWYFESNNTTEDWINYNNKKYSIQKSILSNMSMKSKFFAVLRIDNNDSKSIGLIVVESTNPNRYEEEDIKKSLEEQRIYLSDMLHRLKKYIPNNNIAKGKGF